MVSRVSRTQSWCINAQWTQGHIHFRPVDSSSRRKHIQPRDRVKSSKSWVPEQGFLCQGLRAGLQLLLANRLHNNIIQVYPIFIFISLNLSHHDYSSCSWSPPWSYIYIYISHIYLVTQARKIKVIFNFITFLLLSFKRRPSFDGHPALLLHSLKCI